MAVDLDMGLDLGLDLGAIREAYERDGYVIVDGVIAPQDLGRLRAAADSVTRLTRAGQWPHRRIVGKQFPPFDTAASADSWGVQHLLHPDLAHHADFAAFYASSPLVDVCAALLGVDEARMQLELFNLLIEPAAHAFALGWHRDDIRADVAADEEQQRLAAPLYGVQWNAALWDDDCLFIVPGTHRRLRTEEEKRANERKPPDAVPVDTAAPPSEQRGPIDGAWDVDPPSTKRVYLKAGQTAFYSQRILHRASYVASKKRATLHGCYGGIPEPTATATDAEQEAQRTAVSERARMVLQHGVEWMRQAQFGHDLPDRLQPMWRNLLEMDKAHSTRELGYSLDG